ncbi:cytosine permease [Geodermatophilus obscurus]|uniref:cytosine permease n=1 Tax=Geodermatophilus obscurus TaxID=1861 RepID=UPI00019B7E96|nr:cytosine permease [Geodermatophilus obscurus]
MLIALLVGILIVQVFVNLVAKPSQRTGVPYPVVNRAVFGVKGANVPAIIRGLIAVAWYGVQTFLAASSLNIMAEVRPRRRDAHRAFLPRPERARLDLLRRALGGQAALFWKGMETIKRFIDWAGPPSTSR